MNLNKSLTIHESHLNSIIMSQLNDSCDRNLYDLSSGRSLQTNISRIQTLIREIQKQQVKCGQLDKEAKQYEREYYQFRNRVQRSLQEKGKGNKNLVNQKSYYAIQNAQQFLKDFNI